MTLFDSIRKFSNSLFNALVYWLSDYHVNLSAPLWYERHVEYLYAGRTFLSWLDRRREPKCWSEKNKGDRRQPLSNTFTNNFSRSSLTNFSHSSWTLSRTSYIIISLSFCNILSCSFDSPSHIPFESTYPSSTKFTSPVHVLIPPSSFHQLSTQSLS